MYQRINEAIQAVMLATSRGADLANLAARLD
jgi:phage-related baseplate assembly protein